MSAIVCVGMGLCIAVSMNVFLYTSLARLSHVSIHISVCVHVHVLDVCKSQRLNDNVCDNSVVLINL